MRSAAEAFKVKHQRLSDRLHGIPSRTQILPNSQKLTPTKEQTIIRYILDLDARGYAPRLCEVANIANKLLGIRGSKLVSKY